MVRALPNASNQQGKIQGNGVITLSWELDEPEPPADAQIIFQNNVINWVIEGRITNLRDQSGILVIRDALYNLTVGFTPSGCGPLYARRFEFVERTELYWRFEYRFACNAVIQAVEETDPEVLLKEVFFIGCDETGGVSDQWMINTGEADYPS